ncbi:MAG: MFS transporter [Chloroflexi bacterium]|nr:MFS transporter [Chloroflexota bacterium]
MSAGKVGEREPGLAIPGLIKRNTVLLALSQAFTGAGMHMAYALGPLMVVALTTSAALSGLSVSLMGFSRFLVSYPVGRIMDTYGRKPALQMGLALGLVGAIVVGLAMVGASFLAFVIGLLVFGMGMNTSMQLRVAAADMYPPSRRAEGLGYVLTGAVVGTFGGPVIVATAQVASSLLGLDPLGVPWLFLPVVIVPGIACVALVRPDPKEIASHLDRYYPGCQPEPRAARAGAGRVSVGALLRHYPTRVAFVTNFAGFGAMSSAMVVTSLALAHHGHSLPAISLAQSLHSSGMFAFSLPLGRLADRLGRRAILMPGIAVEAAGALLVVLTSDYWLVTLGTFLVGFGWSGINVTTTALLADATRPLQRGQAVGINDSLAAAASILFPLLVGPMGELFGLASTGLLSVALMAVPLLMLLTQGDPSPEKHGLLPVPAE